MVLCAGGVFSLICAGLLLAGNPPPLWIAVWIASAAGWAIYWLVNSSALAGTLSLRSCGLWEIALPETKKTMRLIHAWPAFGWVTLKFCDTDSTGREQQLELVVWRGSVSRQAWSELRAHIARQVAMPARILQKGNL